MPAKTEDLKAEMAISIVDVNDLRPNGYNPNKHSPSTAKLLLKSVQDEGWTQPIVAVPDGRIVDGEHRWRTAKKAGYSHVPVVYVDLDEQQMRISTLRHNRTRGTEDADMVSEVYKTLKDVDLDAMLDSLQISEQEVNDMIQEVDFTSVFESAGFTDISSESLAREKDKIMAESRKALDPEKQEAPVPRYHLTLQWTGDAADIVKSVISASPVEMIVDLCRPAYEEILKEREALKAAEQEAQRETDAETEAD